MGASSGMGELADNGRALGARHGRLRLAGSHSIVCKNKPVDIVFEAAAKVKGGDRFDGEFGESKIPVFLAAENLKPFISNELVENSRPVFFRPVKGPGKLIGFRAELIGANAGSFPLTGHGSWTRCCQQSPTISAARSGKDHRAAQIAISMARACLVVATCR
jgi:hypothetical protein